MSRKTHPKQYRTVAEAMKALGYTDAQAAAAAGCDRTWITRIRQGMKLRALSTPLRISRALHVPIEALAETDAA